MFRIAASIAPLGRWLRTRGVYVHGYSRRGRARVRRSDFGYSRERKGGLRGGNFRSPCTRRRLRGEASSKCVVRLLVLIQKASGLVPSIWVIVLWSFLSSFCDRILDLGIQSPSKLDDLDLVILVTCLAY